MRTRFVPFLLLALGGDALAATPLCGAITSPTSLTAANSPYQVTCDMTVAPGVTLTVDPGVTVLFDPGTGWTVDGDLQAVGTAAQPIVFDEALAAGGWDGLHLGTNQGGRADLVHATVRHAATAVQVECCWGALQPANLTEVTLEENGVGIGGYAGSKVVVQDSYVLDNDYGANQADVRWIDTLFDGNGVGVQGERMEITGCLFTNNGVGAQLGNTSAPFHYNTLIGNTVGLYSWYGGTTVEHNDFDGNDVAVRVGGAVTPIHLNNFTNVITWAVQHQGSQTVDATNNWWGTTNTATIDGLIYDLLDDGSKGLVDYTPMATQVVADTYSPPVISALAWTWTPGVSRSVDLDCNTTDDGTIVAVDWRITGPSTNTTFTTAGTSTTWQGPVNGVYHVACTVQDDQGLFDWSDDVAFWVTSDTDQDGVVDDWDVCPATPVGTAVDADGCPAQTCQPSVLASGQLVLPAVVAPNGDCRKVVLNQVTPQQFQIASLSACDVACNAAVFNPATQNLVAPWVAAYGDDYRLTFHKVGPTFQLVAYVLE